MPEKIEEHPGFSFYQTGGIRKTSPYDPSYNCIAWAAGENTKWWEPDPIYTYYWPPKVKREYSLEAYQLAFESLGYLVCDNSYIEKGFEKIALFSKNGGYDGEPTHAARQIISGCDIGKWTSKLGKDIDITHELEGAEGAIYGHIAVIMKRKID